MDIAKCGIPCKKLIVPSIGSIIQKCYLFLFIILLIIILLILFLDYEVKGAKRWFQIFNFTLQPSEIIKPIFVILTAWCISKSIEDKKFYLPLLFVFFFLLLSLILMQPDFGNDSFTVSNFFLPVIRCLVI